MNTHKNVIEINGKVYDAKSGILLSGKATAPINHQHSIDGVIRSQKHLNEPVVIKPTTPKKHSTAKTPLSPKPLMRRQVQSPIQHRSPQKSHTLMRRAVQKPVQANNSPVVTKRTTIKMHQRADRATSIAKNPFIQKFNTINSFSHAVTKRTEPLAVKHAPVNKHSSSHIHKPVNTSPYHTQQANTHLRPAKLSKSEQLFNDALAQVSAHEDTKQKNKTHKKRAKRLGSRALKWGTVSLAAVLLIGFIAYMNLANINMQFASARAGFAASMPDYLPSGYRVAGPISYKPGQVAISFISNTDQRTYKLSQEVSQWNSESLEENYLKAQNKIYETTQNAGRTIYLYDNGKATWVNGGVWYQIESNALSTDQLMKIASSL